MSITGGHRWGMEGHASPGRWGHVIREKIETKKESVSKGERIREGSILYGPKDASCLGLLHNVHLFGWSLRWSFMWYKAGHDVAWLVCCVCGHGKLPSKVVPL